MRTVARIGCIVRRSLGVLGIGALLVVVPPLSAASQSAGDSRSGADTLPAGHAKGIVGSPLNVPLSSLPTRSEPVQVQEQVWPENLVEPTTGMNVVWTNRGPGDGFDTIFGAQQDAARAGVDAAIDAWEQAVVSLNRPATPGDETIDITVNMNAGATATSCGGSASGSFDGDGWPTGGAVNINGNANVWFVDPTPHENSEFVGNIDNAFSGDAQAGSPAAFPLCDMQTVVVAEMAHILGMTSNGGSRFQTGGFNTQLTSTGTTCSGPGDLWRFTGASVTHLMTSNNGGPNGSDFGVPVHTAEPCATFGALSGADDSGNALFERGGRYLPPNLLGLLFHDAYNFEIVMPEEFGSFYSTLNSTTGNLLVRGGDDNDLSDDVIAISRGSGVISVNVDIGNDVPGTGPTDAFVSHYPVGEVQSITVQALDGDDSVDIAPGLGIPVTASGGAGNDVISDGDGSNTLNGDGGNDQIFAGAGDNTVADGTGDDLVDLSQNSFALSYTTGGGNDTVLGSPFDDAITGSSGADRLEGRNGDDTLDGNPGNDELFGQEGSDTIVWNNGDGSDIIAGGAGESDLVLVNGAAAGDDFRALALPGSKVSFERTNLTPFTLEIASVEDLRVNAGSGADTVAVNDLSSTDVHTLVLDLGVGDSDSVVVDGRNTVDVIDTNPSGGSVLNVGGLAYDVTILAAEAADNLTVNGRGGADTLIANATSATEVLRFNPEDADTGDLIGIGPMSITADTMEQVIVDGQSGNDTMLLTSPAGMQDVTLAPGMARDAGSVGVAGLLPLQFRDLGLPGSVELRDALGGRADRLIYDATVNGDAFAVAPASGVISLNAQSPVTPTGILNLVLNGLAGDDDTSAAATLPFDTATLNGGDSLDGDSLSLSGAPGAVLVDFGARTITGYGGTFSYTGLEALSTAQGAGAGSDLTVLGTSGRDDIAYTPSSGAAGAIARAGVAPALNFDGVAGVLTIDPGADVDNVGILGSPAAESIVALAAAITTVQVGTMKTASIPVSNAEVISILTDDGADTVDISTFETVSPRLVVEGHLPAAKRFSDLMLVRNGSPSHVMFRDVRGHEPEAGTVFATYRSTGNETQIAYSSIERVRFFR